jgi:hypothetical protein
MTNPAFLAQVGEYALMSLFFLLLYEMLRKFMLIGTGRLTAVLAVLMIASVVGSKYWPLLRNVYIYSFAFMALAGKFTGVIQIVGRSGSRYKNTPFIFRSVLIIIVAFSVIAAEYAQSLLGPLLQQHLPAIWWRAIAWILPSLGVVTTLNDSTHETLFYLFSSGNSRLIVILFLVSAGLLVPIYLPIMDLALKFSAIFGVIIGLSLYFLKYVTT